MNDRDKNFVIYVRKRTTGVGSTTKVHSYIDFMLNSVWKDLNIISIIFVSHAT